MNEWKTLVARVTLLPATATFPQVLSALAAFEKLWGNQPDSFQKNPNPFVPSTARGQIGNLQVVAASVLSRVDLQFMAIAPSSGDGPPPTLALIEDARDLHAMLNSVSQALGQTDMFSDVGRVALSAQFVSLQESLGTANKKLMEFMPKKFTISLDDEEDVVVQVNQPFQGRTLANSTMNFIQNWSVARFQALSFAATLDGSGFSAVSAPVTDVPPVVGASISIEANNAALNRPLKAHEQGALLIEELEAVQQRMKTLGVAVEGF